MRTFTIGRGTGKDIYYANPEVSSNHAEIIAENGNYTLVDHSMNGTIVNGNRVHNSSYPLHRGDTVLFAGREMLDWNRIGPEEPEPQSGTNVFAILGFVFAFIVAPLGIIFSAIGVGKAKKTGKLKGLAIAGLVLSIIFTAIYVIWFFILGAIGEAYEYMDLDDLLYEFY